MQYILTEEEYQKLLHKPPVLVTGSNLWAAKAMLENAIAFGKGGDLKVVMENLKYIKQCLDKPFESNPDYSCDDFK